MSVANAQKTIMAAVTSWPGVSAHPHRFGGTEFRLGRREIGHIHGDQLVDIPFPSRVRNDIVAAGQAEPHHILPDSGWVSLYLRESADVNRALDLLRRSHSIAAQQKARRRGTTATHSPQASRETDLKQ
ncbi:MAG: DUF5519 family protein [Candidatus Promineifilaceae bacterium]|nr:DUF5519 family protein [Candidatus Promineifilaceae bacterium]